MATGCSAHAPKTPAYNGFNLLVGDVLPNDGDADASALHYYSNRLEQPAQSLAPGIYGLSNGFLDTPWPKVTRAVGAVRLRDCHRVSRSNGLIGLMETADEARDCELPATGVPLDWERALSAIQIRANGYGTRDDHGAHGPQRRARDVFRAHVRHQRSGALVGPALRVHGRQRGAAVARDPRVRPGLISAALERGRLHVMSTCGIPQSMYSLPTTA